MKEIESNKNAWKLLSEDHYRTFKEKLLNGTSILNKVIIKELGDIKGKTLMHLQCNTGADTVSLAKLGAIVTGVDLVPDNVYYAKKLAEDLNIKDARFIESDIMELAEVHHEKYDIVFTSEGVIGWLPDLKKWGRTIRSLLKDDGFVYINEIHPFFLMFDEENLTKNELSIKYPYFSKNPDQCEEIGGYAAEPRKAINFSWMFTVSDIINSLTEAGLVIEYFNEFDTLCYKLGDMEKVEEAQFQNPFYKGKMPFQFSLKATVRK